MVLEFLSKRRVSNLVKQAYRNTKASTIEEARELFKGCLSYVGEDIDTYTTFGFYCALGAVWEAGKIQGIRNERKRRKEKQENRQRGKAVMR